MSSTPRLYKKLTKVVRRPMGYSSLWVATDHLLQVRSSGYSEEYHRYFFRDIKGIFIKPSDRRLYTNAVWIVLGLILVIGFSAAGRHALFVGIVAAIAAVPIVWNSVLGAGCRVYLTTGVQTVRVEPLVRRRYADKVLAKLKPMIDEAQTDLVPKPVEPPPTPDMEAAVFPPAGEAGGRRLAARRCLRHPQREAAARCPECGGDFCRECVSDYSGRLLCVTCLAKAAAADQAGPAARTVPWRRGATLAFALIVLWAGFFELGSLLLKLPEAGHEATVWNAPNQPPDDEDRD